MASTASYELIRQFSVLQPYISSRLRTYLPCRSCIGMAKGSIKVGDEVAITATVRKRVTEDRVSRIDPFLQPTAFDRGHDTEHKQRAEDRSDRRSPARR